MLQILLEHVEGLGGGERLHGVKRENVLVVEKECVRGTGEDSREGIQLRSFIPSTWFRAHMLESGRSGSNPRPFSVHTWELGHFMP